MTAAELHDLRGRTRDELATGARHVLGVLRSPEATLRSAPVGDVLSWTDGLDEAKVSRILAAVEIPWGRRIGALTKRGVEAVCRQIKARYPETWQRWRDAVKARA